MATTLEEYQIVIAANAERASEGIDRFIGSLNNFKISIGQALAPAKAFAEAMKAIAGSVSTMNLMNIGTQAEKFAKAMKNAALANKSGGLYKPPASIKEAEALVRNYDEQAILSARREGLRNKLRDTMSMEMPDASKEANLVAQIQKTDAQMQSLDNGARNFAQDMAKSATQVEILSMKMNGIVKNLAFETSKKTLDSSRIASLVSQYQSVSQKISELRANQEAASDGARQFAENVAKGATQASILEDKMASIVAKIASEQSKPNAGPGKIATLSEQYQRLQTKLAEVQQQADATGKSIGQSMGEAAQNGIGKVEKFLSRVGRILSTMLIRQAMKTLVKAFTSAWDSMEAYSKAHGGELARNMETIRGAVSQAAVSLASALAPAMRVVAAAAILATNAIKVLVSAINWLMGLLGLSAEFLGITSDALDGYSDATNGASKANKNLLASFDELNVIQSTSGGGSNNSSGWDLTGFNEQLTQELAAIELIVAEFMLAIGVLLTFTGHPGLGIPMIVLGVAGMVAMMNLDWDGIPEEIRKTCEKIAEIVGLSLLAIGAVIAFSTANIPLGIGLMVAGALSLAASVAINWSKISGNIEAEIAKITDILGKAFLALGAVLTFCGHPGIGIALMAIGAVSLVVSSLIGGSKGDGSIAGTIEDQISRIKTACEDSLIALGAIFAFTGGNIPLGVGLMIAGGLNLAKPIDLDWEDFANKVIEAFTKIGAGIGVAFTAINVASTLAFASVKKWKSIKWSDFSKNWDSIKLNFMKLWNSIAQFSVNAWNRMKVWIDAKWSDFSRNWDRIKDGFDKIWDNIGTFTEKAYEKVKVWLNTKWSDFSQNWNLIRDSMKSIWNQIGSSVSNAWGQVKIWIGASWGLFKNAWESIKNNMIAVWTNIKGSVDSAFASAKKWMDADWSLFSYGWNQIVDKFREAWEEKIAKSINTAWKLVEKFINTQWNNFSLNWSKIQSQFQDVWGAIGDSVDETYSIVIDFSDVKWSDFKSGWEKIRDEMCDLWDTISSHIIDAYTGVHAWLETNWAKNFKPVWSPVEKGFFDTWKAIGDHILGAYDRIKKWWDDGPGSVVDKIKGVWKGLVEWFNTTVIDPIVELFNSVTGKVKNLVNEYLIKPLNALGHIQFGGLTIPLINVTIPAFDYHLWTLDELTADGFYDIPRGDIFVANEAGPELVGSIGGKASVANQMEIIEGIRKGVHDANEDQNALLRQQNELLLGILQKDNGFNGQGNIAFGRFAKRSIQLYNDSMGGK